MAQRRLKLSPQGSVIGGRYAIPLSSLPSERIDAIKKKLTLKAKSYLPETTESFDVHQTEHGHLCLPRFFGLEMFGSARTDLRAQGDPMAPGVSFAGRLTSTPPQQDAANAMLRAWRTGEGGGMLVLPCG